MDIKSAVKRIMTRRAIIDGIAFQTDYSFIKQQPTARQQVFLDLNDKEEVFYGGAASGGKSSALLMAALEYVHVPDYAALLLRKTYVDLSRPGALMDRAMSWLSDSGAHWSDQKKTWTFASGATLTFGYLESENDKYQYQSSEFQFIGFDELSQFTETQYTYLFSRLRKTKNMPVPLRMRAGSNPPAEPIGMWVKDRFIPDDFTPARAHEDRVWEKAFVDEEEGTPGVRYFVPARMDDNPHVDQESYEKSLSQLDPVARAQLRRGDWQISAKGDILHNWEEKQVVVKWSDFWRVMGPKDDEGNPLPIQPHIPHHWQLGVFQDWGTTKDHPCMTGWLATAAENSPTVNGIKIAGKVFLYRTLMRTQNVTARNVKKQIYDVMEKHQEIPRTRQWQMSHEASSERNEYHNKDEGTPYSLPFINWETGKTRGIEQLKYAIEPRDLDKEHPFNQGVMGCPKLLILVDDNHYIAPRFPKDLDGFDEGQARLRAEAPVYKWEKPKSGEPPKKLTPHALFNDAIDFLRSAAATYWPSMEEKTIDEVLSEKIREIDRKSVV